jgi:HEAT repeat protein
MKIHLLNRVALACLLAFTASSVRADEEQDLITILQSTASAPQKCGACQRLKIIGTARSVPALAALLGEERISHAARNALETMPGPEAGAALRKALGQTSGLIKAGLIDSLGWRREEAAAPLLTPLLSDADPIIAAAAASALGKIHGKDAVAALLAARDRVAPSVQLAVLESLLQSAESLLSGGDGPGAASIYRSLFETRIPPHIRAAAWRGLVWSDVGQRKDLITKALSDADGLIHRAALKLLRELNDPQVIKACLRHWASLPVDSQLAVLDAHARVGPDALPAVRAATESPNLDVRMAAWQHLAELNDPSTIPALAQAAASGELAERNAARDTLSRLHGPGVREILLSQLRSAEPPVKAVLLRALGERGDTGAVDVLLQNVGADAGPVRLAALESLRKLAVPDTLMPLLDLAVKSRSAAESEPVLKALYAVCQASRDKDQTARRVIEAMDRASAAERRQVLPLLSELATPAALAAAQAATRDQDSELAKEAVRVLAQWPSAASAPHLLETARTTTDATVHALALRGCIEVTAHEPNASKRLGMLQQAMAAARRPDEKKQALSQIGQIHTPEALQTVLRDLAAPGLANEASSAAISIAEKLAGSNPKLADEAAVMVLAQCKVADIVKRAWALRSKPKGGGPFIRDWLVCGPYSQPGAAGSEGVFNIAFAPEKPDDRVQWKPTPSADYVDLGALYPGQMNCVAYLRTQIIAPQDCDGALMLGSDDGVKAWLNGAVVHSNNIDRGMVIDQDMAPIKLKKGANQLMLKISQGGGGWSACARIVGSDGQPIAGLRIELPTGAIQPVTLPMPKS